MFEIAFTPTQFGGYVEFHHEPTPKAMAMAIDRIYAAIKSDVDTIGVISLGDAKVVYRNADDYEQSRFECDDLFGKGNYEPYKKMWTVGVKITVWHSACSRDIFSDKKMFLREGVAPKPLMIVE